jgi:hypothetical protein
VEVKVGDIVRPGNIEHLVGAGEDPAQASPRQRRGDTSAPPRWCHEHAAEVIASRSSQGRLACSRLHHPPVGDDLAVHLGHEHLARVIGDVGCELLAAVARSHPLDTADKLDGRRDVSHP